MGYIYSTAAETRESNVWDLIIPGGRWGSRWKGWSCFVYCTVYSWPQLESLNEGNWKRGRSSEFIYVDGWMDGKAPLSLVRCPLNEDAAADASNYYDIYECIRGWATARVCGMPRVYHWPPKSSQLASAQWAASLFSSRTVNNRNGLHTCSLSLVIIAFTIKIRHLPLDAAASRYFHGKMRAKRSDKNVEFFHLCSHRRTWETRGLSEPSLREKVFFFFTDFTSRTVHWLFGQAETNENVRWLLFTKVLLVAAKV